MLLTALGRTSLVGGALEPFGLSLIFNETAVALAGFIAGLPLVVRPLQAAFASPRLIELEEAARIHGAGRRDVFLRITLPLVRPSLAAALLLGGLKRLAGVHVCCMIGFEGLEQLLRKGADAGLLFGRMTCLEFLKRNHELSPFVCWS